jgi:glycyl-tRNA synthetase beta chain
MSDFLLELRSEEIPARMQAGARVALEKLFREAMDGAGVSFGALTIWSTPRRLVLIARDMPLETAALSEELKGPKIGAPPQALEGFLRKTGLTETQLTQRDGVYFACIQKPGRATADVLAEAIPAIIRAFPWPKSQRWGAASLSTTSLRWVRPLSGIVALLGDDLVECEVGGVCSGFATMGHRFHHSGEITIGNAGDYAMKLRAAHVIVNHAEREAIIRAGAAKAAADAGLVLVEDEGLVIENAGLTEWPVPLLGRFDEEFLEVPPEVIQLTARTNQKYFTCRDAEGKLANAFVCTANIAASDGGAGVIDGNRKVLAARLSDARFFWEQDRKKTLEQHREKLANIVFHEKLGTVADKVERVAKLARWLVEEGIVGSPPKRGGGPAKLVEGHAPQSASSQTSAMPPVPLHHPSAKASNGPPPRIGEDLATLAEQAARLCKADLTTEMVGEFPELQGLMGGYYARAEGLPDAVADAIRDHYKPVGQGDDVPTAPVAVAVSLADKLDTLAQFFKIDQGPTGSRDPFALRRAAIGCISLIVENELRVTLGKAISQAYLPSAKGIDGWPPGIQLLAFLADRLKVQQREAGVRHDLIDAVFALGGEDDLVRLLARVHALQAFVSTPDGTNLLAGYKRAANILKKECVVPANAGTAGLIDANSAPGGQRSPVEPGTTNALSYTLEPAEKALMDALSTAGPTAAAAVAAEDFAAAMAALALLRAPIDAFFENVTVNDPDPVRRAARLGLLARFRDAVHGVADFSKIEG